MARDDFSAPVKKAIAEGAGFQCSFPRCGKVTLSPDSAGSAIRSGVAAHITAAASGGPRYDARLTSEERACEQNGIWLCDSHARMIDADQRHYPAELLRAWKLAHGLRLRLSQGGYPLAELITDLEIEGIGPFHTLQTLQLAPFTIFTGEPGSGKSLGCEAIAAALTGKYLDRVLLCKSEQKARTAIEFLSSRIHRLEFQADEMGITFYVDGAPTATAPNASTVYWPRPYNTPMPIDAEERSTLHVLADRLGARIDELRTAIRLFQPAESVFGYRFQLRGDDDLLAAPPSRKFMLPYRTLSAGEKERAAVDLMVTLAGYYAKLRPCLLVLDRWDAVPNIDTAGLQHMILKLSESRWTFQRVMNLYADRLDLTGCVAWRFVLSGDPPQTTVEPWSTLD